MNVIQNDIRSCISKELESAKERFPLYASLHEATAIIAEERDEAADEFEEINKSLKMLWGSTKKNNSSVALSSISRMKFRAEALAIEACQIAAVCEKALQSAAAWIGEKDTET